MGGPGAQRNLSTLTDAPAKVLLSPCCEIEGLLKIMSGIFLILLNLFSRFQAPSKGEGLEIAFE
jgi:hypothetical protein